MELKTLLVHVDESRSAETRIEFAAQLAVAHGAHLIGVAPTGILRFGYNTVPDGFHGDLTQVYEQLQAAAAVRAGRFDALASQAGLASFEHRVGDEEAGYALASQAMYADLVIVGQSDPTDPATAPAAIPEYVALHAPCPVLVLPCAGRFGPSFGRVLVAWNASPESACAVRQALPFLARASEVEVATFDGAQAGGAEVALFLARHGIKVTLWEETAGGDVAAALLSRLSRCQADLLVMGCYGHTRFREILLGGVSRTVLQSMKVPTLMAH